MVDETIGPLGTFVREQQTTSPNYVTGTFIIDDSSDHDFKIDGRGKSKVTFFIENPGDQVLTVKVYGMHAIDAAVGDVGVKQIGASFSVATTDNEYRTVGDPFPFYLLRITPAAAATGTITCTLHGNFHSGA